MLLALLTWCGVVGNGSAVLLGVRGEVTVHVVGYLGLNVVGWGRGKRWDTSYTQHKPISIVINSN